MHPISPRNKLIVCFDKKYQDEIITPSGVTFYKDTTFAPEWNATATGVVVSVPRTLTVRGMTHEVQVGDELAFSYWVIQDREQRPEQEDTFSEDSDPDSRDKHFSNRRKESLSIMHLSRREAVGTYLNFRDEILDGCHGTPAAVEKWMSQYHFTNHDDWVYANLIIHEDQEYWKVDYQEALAVKRNGKIIMVGGNVLLEPQVEHMNYEMNHEMHLHLVAKTEYGVSKVVNIGKPLANSPDLGLKAGDTVHFNQNYVQKYELWGENYLIIPQYRILGHQ